MLPLCGSAKNASDCHSWEEDRELVNPRASDDSVFDRFMETILRNPSSGRGGELGSLGGSFGLQEKWCS